MRLISTPLIALIVVLTLLITFAPAHAEQFTLYDDTQTESPGAQPFLLGGGSGTVTETPDATGVNVLTDTSTTFGDDQSAQFGYTSHIPFFNIPKSGDWPTLDRSAGFLLEFELQMLQEAHNSANRAGFSVILLASDLQGVEIGFWDDEVWAQTDTPLFTKGESADFDTTAEEVVYSLLILGDAYYLSADDTQILSGDLKDYSSFGTPYDLPSYLFLGDNTTSAAAEFHLGQVTLTTDIPEPASAALLGLTAMALLRRPRVRASIAAGLPPSVR